MLLFTRAVRDSLQPQDQRKEEIFDWILGNDLHNSPNKTMSHNGRTITNIKSKANVFINHYTRVSKRNMSQSDLDTNQQFKKRIKVLSVDDESCAALLMIELQSAIKKMKNKGAAGPDNILPSFLKSLGHLALQKLLSIFNSLLLAHYPQIWSVATIIPPLKLGNLLVGLFPSYQSHIVCRQVFGTCTSWSLILYCWNQQHVQSISSWFS